MLIVAGYFAYDLWLRETPDLCFTGEASRPLEEVIPSSGAMDVMFAFDQSGSMSSVIAGAKEDGLDLMASISRRRGRQRFGLIGFSDYIDFPYRLYEPLTEERERVQSSIMALDLADGGDAPESYGRVMYESYTDERIGWDEDAQKFLVIFGDSVPHDPDRGPDETADTADDLILTDVLETMNENEITLVFVAPPTIIDNTALVEQWEGWSSQTGGDIVRCQARSTSR